MLHLHDTKYLNHAQPRCKPSNCFILLMFSNFFNFHAIHERVSHGHSTIGGIQYDGCGEDKKKEIVSHQLGVSTGYGDAHQ